MLSSSPGRIVNVDESIPTRVLEYAPKKFDLGVPQPAKTFMEQKRITPTGFKMADTVRIHTGVDDIEAKTVADQAEEQVLHKLKEIQEIAYKEAYQLGLEEGKKDAFNSHSARIEANLEMFDKNIEAIAKIKTELIAQNEAHMMKLIFQIGCRIANHEIKDFAKESVLKTISKALELAQTEENITVTVANSQLEFLEELQKANNREFEFLKKIKLTSSDDVFEGGCVVHTNYGEIDARVEERVAKLWEEIEASLPRVKEKLSA
jgi:flagellar assembly protein FliH